MHKTMQALTSQPMRTVWQYVFALLGGSLAMGLHVYLSFRGVGWLAPQRIWDALGAGLMFGHAFAFMVIFSSDTPRRLRGIWSKWLLMPSSLLLSLAFGASAWLSHTVLLLLNTSPDWGIILIGAAGLSLGLLLNTWFDLSPWLAMPLMIAAVIASIMLPYQRFLATINTAEPTMALLYFASNRPWIPWSISGVFAVLLALGAFLPLMWQQCGDNPT